MTGKHPMDAMLDLAIDEDLRTEFTLAPANGTEPKAVAEILGHPHTHPWFSDGGAHTRYQTVGQGSMTLEKSHYKISGLPAYSAGFTDLGILTEGFAADIIVYSQRDLGLQYDSPVYTADCPGGERRIIHKAKGIRYTVVNSVVTFLEGTVCTEATPGEDAPKLRHGKSVVLSQSCPERPRLLGVF